MFGCCVMGSHILLSIQNERSKVTLSPWVVVVLVLLEH